MRIYQDRNLNLKCTLLNGSHFTLEFAGYVSIPELRQWISENKGYKHINICSSECQVPLQNNQIITHSCEILIIITDTPDITYIPIKHDYLYCHYTNRYWHIMSGICPCFTIVQIQSYCEEIEPTPPKVYNKHKKNNQHKLYNNNKNKSKKTNYQKFNYQQRRHHR